MIELKNNKPSISPKLCQQCGACLAVCKRNAITSTRDANSGLLKLEIDTDKCVGCKLCYNVCPANKDSRIENVDEYCRSKRFLLGHNKDNEIRRKASSGGVARSIIVEGLANGLFDGVYTLRKTDEYPFAGGRFYTKENLPTFDDIPNSVYHSVPLNENMAEIKKCKRLLIVGTSCQLRALNVFLKNKCEELYSLCIFCKQQKIFKSSRFIAKLAKEKIKTFEDIKSFSYRGDGWPGYCEFNGKRTPWGVAALMPFGKKLWTVPGCDICGNPFGDNADITVLDPWVIHKTNDLGDNLIVAHTDRGLELLHSVKCIELTEMKYNEIEKSLMIDDINRKNSLIDFFRGKESDKGIVEEGKTFVKKRKFLEKTLEKLPRMPLIFYKVLARIIKV